MGIFIASFSLLEGKEKRLVFMQFQTHTVVRVATSTGAEALITRANHPQSSPDHIMRYHPP